ncbi:MAG: hypothetical protein PF481_00865 [Bacteroidales bacterium]|jgi:hypothetical protein|nr:hypothetical protein [Bacteroidales bacterium]
MGLLGNFFNPRKPRSFEYNPVYYDAQAEKKEAHRKRVIQDMRKERGEDIDNVKYVPNIRGQFRVHKEQKSRIVHRQNVRIILIFIILLYFAYIFYTHL